VAHAHGERFLSALGNRPSWVSFGSAFQRSSGGGGLGFQLLCPDPQLRVLHKQIVRIEHTD
jgi:hypothetical protein